MKPSPADELDVKAAARVAGRTTETIRRWVWSGRLPARKRGNRLVMARKDVEALAGAAERRHLDRAWELSRRYDNHPVYDMLYAATAEAAGMVLITADETLLERLGNLGWVRRPGV